MIVTGRAATSARLMLVPVTITSESSPSDPSALEESAAADGPAAADAASGLSASAARAAAAAMSNTLTTPRTVHARQSLPECRTLSVNTAGLSPRVVYCFHANKAIFLQPIKTSLRRITRCYAGGPDG